MPHFPSPVNMSIPTLDSYGISSVSLLITLGSIFVSPLEYKVPEDGACITVSFSVASVMLSASFQTKRVP